MDLTNIGKLADSKIYGIDWNATDDDPGKKPTQKIREKPFCEIEDCNERVSTERGKRKPFCKDHVFENPYVQDLLKRIESTDTQEESRKAKEAFERAKAIYE